MHSEARREAPVARRKLLSGIVLVTAVLLSCSPRPEARVRFLFWAKYVSREARNATVAASATNSDDEVEVLRRRLHISDRQLEAILAEAQAEKWPDSPRCQPAPEPYYTNALLLRPKPMQRIEGHQTRESCSRQLQGTVIVDAVIGANGAATGVTVRKGIDPVLDQQAVKTIESAPWLPALLCARPVDVHYTLAISFRLSSCSGVSGSPDASSQRTPGPLRVPAAAHLRLPETRDSRVREE